MTQTTTPGTVSGCYSPGLRTWEGFAHTAVAAALLLSTFVLSACKDGNSASKQSSGPPPVPVVVAPVERKDLPLTVAGIGNVEPIETVSIKSRIDGEIVAVHVRDGQDVTKGQLLFELDARYLEAQLKQLEANEAKDRALLANAQSLEKRYADLLSKKFISEEAFTQARTSRAAAEAAVAASRAAAQTARVQLSYTRIASPINGRTGRVLLQVGNVVKANDTPPLVVINQIAPIYVNFAIPEQYLDDIRAFSAKGVLAVRAAPQGAPANEAVGKLTFIDNRVDATTGTIKLGATFTNADQRLWPGQFATATLTLQDERGVLVVPGQALQNGPDGQYVYVVKPDGTAEMRNVSVARTEGERAVIATGLEAGESVIVMGQLRVTPGAKVLPKAI